MQMNVCGIELWASMSLLYVLTASPIQRAARLQAELRTQGRACATSLKRTEERTIQHVAMLLGLSQRRAELCAPLVNCPHSLLSREHL